MPDIRLEQLSHCYPGGRKFSTRQALNNIDLWIESGDFFVLTGPNGGGKSTLFQILCGLLSPSSGRILVDGLDLAHESAKIRARMGVVFQKPALDPHLTVIENLKIHADLYGLNKTNLSDPTPEALAWTDLADRGDQPVKTLSGGLARQLELAKALMHHPALLILDEPTTGLDPGARHAFIRTLKQRREADDLTILMTSHLFSEADSADGMGILQNGRLIAADSPQALKAMLGKEMVVVRSRDPERLRKRFASHPGLLAPSQEGELRIEGADAGTLAEEILANHRDQIHYLTIKEPTLEDVFIHMTGHTLEQAELEAQSDDGETKKRAVP